MFLLIIEDLKKNAEAQHRLFATEEKAIRAAMELGVKHLDESDGGAEEEATVRRMTESSEAYADGTELLGEYDLYLDIVELEVE